MASPTTATEYKLSTKTSGSTDTYRKGFAFALRSNVAVLVSHLALCTTQSGFLDKDAALSYSTKNNTTNARVHFDWLSVLSPRHHIMERKPSQTALLVAAYRARASKQTHAICNDPWAASLAGAEGEALAAAQDKIFPHLELWTALRTAYLDRHVSYWTREMGFTQVVVLGAGLDTRAARLARADVRWFEVDHGASQEYKRRRTNEIVGYPTGAATYVSCDFETESFVERLVKHGFRVDAPALILWEGVTPYLTAEAVRETLSRIATGCHPGSVLLFDIINRAKPPEPLENDTRAFVAKLGEPVLFGSRDILPLLAAVGFQHVRSVSFDEACLTLTGTYLREREFRFQRIVLCSKNPSFHPM